MSNISLRPMIAGLLLAGAVISLSACQSKESAEAGSAADVAQTTQTTAKTASSGDMPQSGSLAAILAAQPAAVQARYAARHPAETLDFFGIEPGMNVLEALPGGGWYTKILVPYLGSEGMLVGVDYDQALFPLFGFMSAEQLKAKETWVDTWLADARSWFNKPVASIDAFQFGALPERFEGELDAALFIRALHNMARFEEEGGFLTASLMDTKAALKPGGIVGVVQHMAPEDAADDWADGSAGYLKKSFVIGEFEAAGFEFVGESDINVNPMDQPTGDDIVWRLPPTLSGSADDPQRAAEMSAIGESSRMTLLFRKPE
ncbi:methyltransferase [Congregibacter variabilis]|uniref:Methyltransferase n=1 Tax=Congregibacter variabilis TaxID=3081200 RepID=A0ABZ0I7Q8_9GAMM|nr:methyltransferase [Congregibacter sp. IMCC43200]